MGSLPIAPPVGGGSPQKRERSAPGGRCVQDAVAASVRFHRWGLGFRQSSFRPITRVLRDDTFSVFQCPPLLRHAPFPSGFRLQVNRMTQEQPSELLLTESGIQHRVPRRTLSYSSGSPVPGGREGFRPRACRPPHPPRLRSTCPPSPCGRLSRPRTTTGTLSPWGRPQRDL